MGYFLKFSIRICYGNISVIRAGRNKQDSSGKKEVRSPETSSEAIGRVEVLSNTTERAKGNRRTSRLTTKEEKVNGLIKEL